jgi:hypothetical protein
MTIQLESSATALGHGLRGRDAALRQGQQRLRDSRDEHGYTKQGDIGHPMSIAALMMGGAFAGGATGSGGGGLFNKIPGMDKMPSWMSKIPKSGFSFGGGQQQLAQQRPMYQPQQPQGPLIAPGLSTLMGRGTPMSRNQMLAQLMRRA